MTKKSQAASAAEANQAELQTSATATDETVSEQAAAEQAGVPSAENPPVLEEPVRGRALIDLPAHGLKCGEFGTLPYATARALWAVGEFDPRAVEA